MISPPNRMQESGPFADLIKQFNRLRDYAVSLRLGDGATTATRRTSYGQIIEKVGVTSVATESEPGTLQQYIVTAVDADHLECRLYSGGSASGSTVNIAKPHELRQNVWSNQTIQFTDEFTGRVYQITFNGVGTSGRTATLKTAAGVTISVEQQVVIPRYIPGVTVILAMTSEQELGITSPTGITKCDVNVGSRTWVRLLP